MHKILSKRAFDFTNQGNIKTLPFKNAFTFSIIFLSLKTRLATEIMT